MILLLVYSKDSCRWTSYKWYKPMYSSHFVSCWSYKMIGLSIAHLNVRGLTSKIDEVKYLLFKHDFKIFCTSETFLGSRNSSEFYGITVANYQFQLPKFLILRRFFDVVMMILWSSNDRMCWGFFWSQKAWLCLKLGLTEFWRVLWLCSDFK